MVVVKIEGIIKKVGVLVLTLLLFISFGVMTFSSSNQPKIIKSQSVICRCPKELNIYIQNVSEAGKVNLDLQPPFKQNYTLPTHQDLIDFLSEDDTDERAYSDNFLCSDFSSLLVKRLYEQGIFSCIATIYYDGGMQAHEIVAVNTTEGVLYVEPQADVILTKKQALDMFGGGRLVDCFSVK